MGHERFEALGPFTGFIVGVLFTIVTDAMLNAIGVYPPSGQPMVNAARLGVQLHVMQFKQSDGCLQQR
jgi:hypothetical protein